MQHYQWFSKKTMINATGLLRALYKKRTFFKPARYTEELSPHLGKPDGIPIFRLLNEEGVIINNDSKLIPNIGKEMARKMLKSMITVGVMDQILYDAQRQGRISFYMTTTGEEATHIGSAAALAPEDPIFGQYREVGSLLWRGFSLTEIMNQCYSNCLDKGKGRQMPIHYGSAKHHFQTISSPLATQIPQAAGAAYALKLRGAKNVVMCYFGEGAASEGDFHAGLNIAATTQSPVIYFCRNNHYAISTSLDEQYRGDGIASRGPAYGIPAFRVDGNDMLAVYKVTELARELALQSNDKNTPVLIEAITYRVGHHSTSDDSSAYRQKEELEQWTAKNDPTSRFRKFLESKSWWDEKDDQTFRESVRQEVLKELSAAEKRQKPPISDMFTDVYDELYWNLKEQQEQLKEQIKSNPSAYPLAEFKDSEAFLK